MITIIISWRLQFWFLLSSFLRSKRFIGFCNTTNRFPYIYQSKYYKRKNYGELYIKFSSTASEKKSCIYYLKLLVSIWLQVSTTCNLLSDITQNVKMILANILPKIVYTYQKKKKLFLNNNKINMFYTFFIT